MDPIDPFTVDPAHFHEDEREEGDWPDHCHACGAPQERLIWDMTMGFVCLSCGKTDADE